MASLSELLLRGAQESVAGIRPEGIAQPLAKGFELAQQAERTNQNRVALEQKKTQLELNKNNTFLKQLEIGLKIKDPQHRKLYLEGALPRVRDSLGLEEQYPDEMIKLFTSSESAGKRALGLRLRLRSELRENPSPQKQQEVLLKFKGLMTPEEFAQLDTEKVFEAAELGFKEKEAKERAVILGGLRAEEAEKKREESRRKEQEAAQIVARKKIGAEFASFRVAGGQATLESNLTKLKGALSKLESGKVKTGKISAFLPGEAGQQLLNPEVVEVQDNVRGAVIATLKQTLGAQFTEKEGERIFNLAFNPRLDTGVNIRKLKQQITQLEQTSANKIKEFRAAGFDIDGKEKGKPETTPKLKTPGGKVMSAKQIEALKALPDATRNSVIQKLADSNKLTVEEVRKNLGIK